MAPAVLHSISAPSCFALPQRSKGSASLSTGRRCTVRAIAEPPTKASPTPTIEESEAAVVAGNAPYAPPAAPKAPAPEGTPSNVQLVSLAETQIECQSSSRRTSFSEILCSSS